MKVLGLTVAGGLVLLGPRPAYASTGLDPSFGAAGKTITTFGHDASVANNGMALQTDGKIVVVGSASNGSNLDWRIARYNPNGALDSSFGSGGTVSRDFGDVDSLRGVAIQPGGKIVVGGYSRVAPGNAQWTVARYNNNGTPDLSFGSGGLATSFGSSVYSSNLLGVALQIDGKIVAVGYTRGPGLLHDDITVARYNTDGSADSSFGSGGTVTTGLNYGDTPNDRGNAMAIQPDGKIVVFGDYDTGEHRDNVVLLRYNIDGSLDPTLNGSGIRTDNFSFHNGGRSLKIQSDGKIVVSGATCSGGACDSYVARYNTNGGRDGGFGSGGVTIISFTSGSDSANSVAVTPDGLIVLVGSGQDGASAISFVSRFNTYGTLDTSFGSGGTFLPALSPNGDSLSAVIIQPDSKIVVGGTASNGHYNDWAIARIGQPAPTAPPTTPPPGNDHLPTTGTAITGVAMIGGALLAIGTLFLLLARWRRRAES